MEKKEFIEIINSMDIFKIIQFNIEYEDSGIDKNTKKITYEE